MKTVDLTQTKDWQDIIQADTCPDYVEQQKIKHRVFTALSEREVREYKELSYTDRVKFILSKI